MASSRAAGIAGIPGLDRKAMEQERLARLAARKRAASSQDDSPRKIARIQEPARDLKQTIVPPTKPTVPSLPVKAIEVGTGKLQATLKYPQGVVLKTWARGHQRHRDITIEEVFEKDSLNIAVLSSFQWDMEWIFSKLDMARTKVELIMQAQDDDVKAQYRHESLEWSKSLRLHFPQMSAMGCMHSKLMLLFHPTHLRIVIPTANLVDYDWGETGVMENTVFLIDLPRLPDDAVERGKTTTAFSRELVTFLNAMTIDDDVISGVLKFDFSKTSEMAFIHSVGGTHLAGNAAFETGYLGLSKAVGTLNLAIDHTDPLQFDYVTSSLGALNDDQLKSMTDACRGTCLATTKRAKVGIPSVKNDIRIYFPTHETVRSSTGGTGCGGTICFQSKSYDSKIFPTGNLRDCISRRKGLLSHNKILLCRSTHIAWLYIGSSNLTQSAWGKLTKDRATKKSKMTCKNWECGVLLKVKGDDSEGIEQHDGINSDSGAATLSNEIQTHDKNNQKHAKILGMEVFGHVLDLPFQWPGDRYAGKRPWLGFRQQD